FTFSGLSVVVIYVEECIVGEGDVGQGEDNVGDGDASDVFDDSDYILRGGSITSHDSDKISDYPSWLYEDLEGDDDDIFYGGKQGITNDVGAKGHQKDIGTGGRHDVGPKGEKNWH
ncbi:unnamed protein product, partial [Ilex paraguariensis]